MIPPPTKRYLDPVFLGLPQGTREGLAGYIEARHRPGHFLQAVLSNDLVDAVTRADSENQAALSQIVRWLVWHAPAICWGSRAKVGAWVAWIEDADEPPDVERARQGA